MPKKPQPSNQRKSMYMKMMLAFFSLALVATMSEIGIRTFFPVASQLYSYHPDRHYGFEPSTVKLHLRHPDNGGGSFKIRINDHGFRGDNFQMERAPSRKRLAIFGDSFVAGEYSSLEATFCEQLEAKLGDTWEVINAGVTGYGLDQTLLKMESEVDRLRPDAVMVVVCSENDSIDLMRNKLFELDSDGKLQHTDARLSESMRSKLRPPFALHPRNSLLAKTAIRAARSIQDRSSGSEELSPKAICEDFLARCRAQFKDFQKQNNLEVTEVIEDFYDIDWALNPDSEISAFKRDVTKGILERMQRTTTERELPFSMVVVPSIRDVVENDDVFAKGLRAMPGHDPARLTQHYQELADELGIRSLNLFQPFTDHGAEQLYFAAHDSHWNDLGQQFAAGLAFEFLQSNGATSQGKLASHP